jgi:hypothetical protein
MKRAHTKSEAIYTFIHTPEGQITVAVVRLADDRLAIYEKEEDAGWPGAGRTVGRQTVVGDPGSLALSETGSLAALALYEWTRALPNFYSSLACFVNNHPARHRDLLALPSPTEREPNQTKPIRCPFCKAR